MKSINTVLVIPRSGRTFENFIHKISEKIPTEQEHLSQVIATVAQGKKSKSVEKNNVDQYIKETPLAVRQNIGVFIDRKREQRPFRIGFLSYDFEFNGYNYRIEGDEPHNCASLIALGEADIAVAGWDELLNVRQSLLSDHSITKWGMYNYHLPKTNKVRIAGSAMLTKYNNLLATDIQDFVGFFLIAKQKPNGNYKYPKDYLTYLIDSGTKVFVKGRYVDIVRTAFHGLNIIPVHDVEDAVEDAEIGCFGLEIVQSGSTLKSKSLVVLGDALFISESVYVVDYYKYNDAKDENNESMRSMLNHLSPKCFFDEERIRHFALWYLALELNLGDNWVNKPSVLDMFFNETDINKGLRPVRLETRYWRPSDTYKIEEAKQKVIDSKQYLLTCYEELSKKYAHKEIS